MTKIGFGEDVQSLMSSEDVPYNIYLVVSMVSAIFGLIFTIECHSYWEKAKDEHRPIVAIVCGAISVVCLLIFRNAYNSDSGWSDWDFFSYGWGRTLALLCFIAAPLCVLAANKVQEKATENEAPDSLVDLLRDRQPKVGKQQIQTKMETLKSRFLSGEITAEEYEREKKLVQDISDELGKSPEERPKTPGTSAKKGQLQAEKNEAHFSGFRYETSQVICPACGQIQSAQRECCWNCKVRFLFDGEA